MWKATHKSLAYVTPGSSVLEGQVDGPVTCRAHWLLEAFFWLYHLDSSFQFCYFIRGSKANLEAFAQVHTRDNNKYYEKSCIFSIFDYFTYFLVLLWHIELLACILYPLHFFPLLPYLLLCSSEFSSRQNSREPSKHSVSKSTGKAWVTMAMMTRDHLWCVRGFASYLLQWVQYPYVILQIQGKKLTHQLSCLIKVKLQPRPLWRVTLSHGYCKVAWWLTFILVRSMKFLASGLSFVKWRTNTCLSSVTSLFL